MSGPQRDTFRFLPRPVWGGIGIALVLGLTLLAHSAGLTRAVDNVVRDAGFAAFPQPTSGQLAMVVIDQGSITALGTWPWPRGYHAAVLSRLQDAGARRIGFDITFSSPSQPDEDDSFAQALERAGDAVGLPMFASAPLDFGSGGIVVSAPLAGFSEHAETVAINLRQGADGFVRQLPYALAYDGETYPFISTWLAGLPVPDDAGRTYLLDLALNPDDIQRLSYYDVMTGAFDPAAIAGRDILIGATALDVSDDKNVPLYGSLPGLAVIALGYEALVQGRALQEASPVVTYLSVVVMAFGAIMAFSSMRALNCALSMLGIAIVLLAAYLFFYLGSAVAIEVAPPALAALLAFVLVIALRYAEQHWRLAAQSRAIIDRQNLFQTIFDNVAMGLLTADKSGRVISVNPAMLRIFRCEEADVLGQNISTFIQSPDLALDGGQDTAAGTWQTVAARRKGGGNFKAEILVVGAHTHDREINVVWLRTQAPHDESEAAVQQSHKLQSLGLLAWEVARKTNEYFASLQAYAARGREVAAAADPASPVLAEIARVADRGADLTEHLLKLSDVDEVAGQATDVSVVVNQLAPLLRHAFGDRFQVTLTLADDTNVVAVSPAQLETIIIAICVSARDAMPDGGLIAIETARFDYVAEQDFVHEGPFSVISVTSAATGLDGIRPAPSAPSTVAAHLSASGASLGSIYRLVNEIGGRIQIESELGGETTVRVYLPERPAGDAPPPLADFDISRLPSGSEKILMVEDDAVSRRHSTTVLRSLGYNVVEGGNVDMALGLIDQGVEFDLLVASTTLSESRDGQTLAASAQRRWPSARILYTAPRAKAGMVAKTLFDRNAAVVAKPYTPSDMATAVRALLDGRPGASRI